METENIEDVAKTAINENRVGKAGRLATRDDLIHLRDEAGKLLPVEIDVGLSMTLMIRPACIGQINRMFPGAIWGRNNNAKVNFGEIADIFATSIVLEDGTKLTKDDLLEIFPKFENFNDALTKWFDISGLKPDPEMAKKAEEWMKRMEGDYPNSQKPV